jgi:acyl-CoA thioester hydrolase
MNWLIEHRLAVRFSDCDLLGHVNNARYLTYLEEARIRMWLLQLGSLDPSAAKNGPRGQAFILARTEIDFRAQARYPEVLDVRIALASFGRTSLVYDYEVVRVGDEVVVARAKTVQVWFDYDLNVPVAIDEPLKAKLSAAVSRPS